MASSEEDQLFAGAFNFIMGKYFRLSWIDTSNCKVVELKMNLHTSRITFQKDSSFGPKYLHLQDWSLKLG